MSNIIPMIIVVLAALIAFGVGAAVAKRKGYTKPGEVVARCRHGHLFTTAWASGASHKRIDLGWARIQRCPVDGRLTLVYPVDQSQLTSEQKKLAKQHRDGGRDIKR